MEPNLVAAIERLTLVLRDHMKALDELAESMRMLEAEMEIHRRG
tara:strand:- start:78 stop:209 length:132 start_codon:yes stop_codon:yes gene_type:complete